MDLVVIKYLLNLVRIKIHFSVITRGKNLTKKKDWCWEGMGVLIFDPLNPTAQIHCFVNKESK